MTKREAKREAARQRALGNRTEMLRCVRPVQLGRSSSRMAAVASQFGLPLFQEQAEIVSPVELPLRPGRIVALVGPSGSGKSSLLGALIERLPQAVVVDRVSFPSEAAVVDRVASSMPLEEALSLLSACALGEPRLWVRPFGTLSEGERFRARFARALGLALRPSEPLPLLCDEFCSALHRRAARAISFNLRKLVTRRQLTLVVAVSNEDVLTDLQPDVVVRLDDQGRSAVEDRRVRPRRLPSFARELHIEPGGKRDYDAFAPMHYRASDELGFVDKVFVLRERRTGVALGIVVYAHPPLELALRNQATNGKFVRNPRRLNQGVRILRRLVVHPDIRGCGFGHHLVAQTMPQLGTEYVECLAAMGAVNPVFEKAGMKRIGKCQAPARRQALLAKLHELEVDPHAANFFEQVARRPRVRRVVARAVSDWYSTTTGGGEKRVARQSPELLAQTFRGLIGSTPIYYLWERSPSKAEGDHDRQHPAERMGKRAAADAGADLEVMPRAKHRRAADPSRASASLKCGRESSRPASSERTSRRSVPSRTKDTKVQRATDRRRNKQ
jgi:ABC-type lipoprotein export system ATPase subunit/GNAT superfamily N-acetyltransferase